MGCMLRGGVNPTGERVSCHKQECSSREPEAGSLVDPMS